MKKVYIFILLTTISLLGCSSNAEEVTISAVEKIKEEKVMEMSKQFMSPLGLTDEEKVDLLAFLNVLGGEPPIYWKPELP